MVPDTISYDQFDKLLSKLGFSRHCVEPKWIRYEHAESNTVIILADKKLSEPVRPTDLLSARLHLIQKGLVREEELDEMFAQTVTQR